MSGRMMSESLGKASFWTILFGFNLTFLVQHSAGLSGMPRRIYEYTNHDWTAYNLISTVGSFVLAFGVLLTVINIAVSLKRGAFAGPDPWKANTLEWFTSSPPPENNFDIVPRGRALGRADEGHPPPGRAADGRRAALPGRPRPRHPLDGGLARHPQRRLA